MCLQRLVTTYCNNAGQKERNEWGGGESHISVTLHVTTKRRKPTERRKRATNKAGKSSSALFELQRSVGTQRRALGFDLFFFFNSFPLFLSFFLENTPKRHARDNNCVLYNRLLSTPSKNQPLLKPSNKYKRKEKIFPSPKGEEKSTAFTPQTCTVFFARPVRYNERCGVEKEQLLRCWLFQNAAMCG